MNILLIIPAYNEEANILRTYQGIQKYNQETQSDYKVIIIDDGSKDRTAEICLENDIPHVSLIHNLGIGGAVQTGYKYASDNDIDIAIQFDGDGQHDVNYIKEVIDPIIEGNADFVIGSRFINGSESEFKSSFFRRVGIRVISFCIKLMTGKTILDTTSGFRAVNREIIHKFAHSYPAEYPEPITTTELLCSGFIGYEVPVKMHERIGGESSIRTWKSAYYMLNVILTILTIALRRRKHVK